MSLIQGMGNIAKLFGAAIRKQRENLGLSQEELGFRARLHRTYIADIERGARNPSLASVAKLSKALQLSLADLFARIPTPADPPRGDQNTGTNTLLMAHVVEILLVEDSPNDAELAIRALQDCNFSNRVHIAVDGAQALDFIFCTGAYTQRRPDQGPHVILLDLDIPKVSGLKVLKRLKSDPNTRTIPVIVLTVSREERDLRESRLLGADDCIVKPVDFQQFSHSMPRVGLHWLLLKQPQNL